MQTVWSAGHEPQVEFGHPGEEVKKTMTTRQIFII